MDGIPVEKWAGMKVLTVREPWASLIVGGWKPVENRSRRFGYTGPLLIHASKGMSRKYYDLAVAWISKHVPANERPDPLPTFEECKENAGKILGGCVVWACFFGNPSGTAWSDESAWHLQLYQEWKAADPVAAKGALGLWTYRPGADSLRSPAV